jgi:hypothetical protein
MSTLSSTRILIGLQLILALTPARCLIRIISCPSAPTMASSAQKKPL